MTKISIALCTYNGAKFLQEQLESFIEQTRPPDELVVCDDCSQDNTVQIIEDFSRDAPFPVFLHVNEKNLGSTKNFEKAISLCTGEIIFLSDQDDVWLPHKIERIEAKFAREKDVALVFSDAELVDENLKSMGHTLWSVTFSQNNRRDFVNGKSFEVLLWQNVVTGATAAFYSKFRQVFMPIPNDIPDLLHDAWIALLIANEAKITFIDEPLIKYRQHDSQQLGVKLGSSLKNDWPGRKKHFAASIKFLQNEVKRLAQMGEIMNEFPQFEKRRGSISIKSLMGAKKENIKHCEARKNLPLPRLQRIWPIYREFITGRYSRISKGLLSAAKDLLKK